MPGLLDRNIGYIRKRVRIPAVALGGMQQGTTVLESHNTAGVTYDEIASALVGAVTMTTDDEVVGGMIACPYDLDPKFEVGFRLCYTGVISSAPGTTLWIVLQDAIGPGIVIGPATVALDTTIADHTYIDDAGANSAVNNLIQWTARGIRDDIGLTRTQIETGSLVMLSIEKQLATNETSIQFVALEMDYMPQMTKGIGNEVDGPLTSEAIV